jgi:hypothetical protein
MREAIMSAVSRPGRNEREPLPAGLVRVTLYFLPDSAVDGTHPHGMGSASGRLLIEREVARPHSQADYDRIESLRVQYENPHLSAREREGLKDAAGDYAASWVDGQWRVTWWQTVQSLPLSRAADVLDGSALWLRGMVEHPLADAASRAGAQGPLVDIGSGITANFVTAPLTRPLEGAARVCEVAGIVIGLATGMHPLVIACAKRLAHDELQRGIARGFEQIISSPGAGRERTADTTRGTGIPTRGDYSGRSQRFNPAREPGTGRKRSRGRAMRSSTDPAREPGTGRKPPTGRGGYPGRDGKPGRGGR